MTATWTFDRSSASVNARPATGFTPRTVKNCGVTARPMTCSGTPPPVRFDVTPRVAAIAMNDRFSRVQSV